MIFHESLVSSNSLQAIVTFCLNMSSEGSSQIASEEGSPTLGRLDSDGDIVFLVEGQEIKETDPDRQPARMVLQQSPGRFLVSSTILTVASPMLVKLFNSKVPGSTQMEYSSCPTIPLRERDPGPMKTILRIFHFQSPGQVAPMDAEKLTIQIIHCDKYYCTRALQPWILNWFKDCDLLVASEKDCGYPLLASHLFRS